MIMILSLKQMRMILTIIDDDIFVEADDGDGDLREWVAKPLFGHPATCSIVGHLAAKLLNQNKRDLSFFCPVAIICGVFVLFIV